MSKYQQFLMRSGAFVPTTDVSTTGKIAPGVYEIELSMNGDMIFMPKDINTDEFIKFPDMVTTQILEEIDSFWAAPMREKFDKLNIVYKRGILMYGVPGTGKTSTIFQVVKKVTDEGGIAIYNADPRLFSRAVQAIKDIQGDCKILCIFEEFDKYCSTPNFLSLLDGELQVSNVLYIATTNYIDSIPDAIKKRPSRFATTVEVTKPGYEGRRLYFATKLPHLPERDLNYWAKITEGCVIDQLKDIMINVECFGRDLKQSVKTVKALGSSSLGISGSNDDDLYKEEVGEVSILGFKVGSIKS